VKDWRAGELVDFAVAELNESRLLRAGMLQVATGESGPGRHEVTRVGMDVQPRARDGFCEGIAVGPRQQFVQVTGGDQRGSMDRSGLRRGQ
jgi:hypothetical protein